MTRSDHPKDDRAAERALRALEEGRLPSSGDGGSSEVDAETRAYLEVLGLLPYELDERPPSPEVKARLLAAVRDGGGAGAVAGEGEPAAAPVLPLPEARHRRTPPSPRPAAPAWFRGVAAALVVAVLGLALFSGWLYGEVSQQRQTIARLSQDLDTAARQADTLAGLREELERARRDLSERLTLVATPGVEVCPLRPMPEAERFAGARGLLFLSGTDGEWYARVAHVEPAPEGRRYRLWFRMDGELVSAGTLEPSGEGEDAVELAGESMPSDGTMSAALVTLEPAGDGTERPQGPTLLFGDERMDMI